MLCTRGAIEKMACVAMAKLKVRILRSNRYACLRMRHLYFAGFQFVPKLVEGLTGTGITQVSACGFHTCALSGRVCVVVSRYGIHASFASVCSVGESVLLG